MILNLVHSDKFSRVQVVSRKNITQWDI